MATLAGVCAECVRLRGGADLHVLQQPNVGTEPLHLGSLRVVGVELLAWSYADICALILPLVLQQHNVGIEALLPGSLRVVGIELLPWYYRIPL